MPLLLPWLPGRAFAIKGMWTGLLAAILPVVMALPNLVEAVGVVLITAAISAFLALNFTGASTITSLTGVRREMRVAMPVLGVVAALGLGAWVLSLVLG